MHLSTAFKALATSALLAQSAAALQAVTRSGRYLYTADGNRFYIKGIAYQEQGPFSFFSWEELRTEHWPFFGLTFF